MVVPLAPVLISTGQVNCWCHGFEDGGGGYPGTWFDNVFGGVGLANAAAVLSAAAAGRWGGYSTVFNGAASLSSADSTALRAPGNIPLTFSVWVKLSTLVGDHPIISKRGAGGIEYELRYDSTVQRWVWAFWNSTTGILYNAISFQRPAVGTWYLLFCEWDAANLVARLSINAGFPQSDAVGSAWAYTLGQVFRIGEGHTGSLNGQLQDVTRWNRLLTQSEKIAVMGRSMVDLYSVITAASPGSTGSGIYGYPVASAPVATLDFALDTSGANPVLSWVNDAVDSISVEIQRDDGAGFVTLTQTYHDDAWTDEDVTLPASVTYRIRSINPFGASAWSAELSTTAGSSAIVDGEGTVTDGEGTITDGET